MIGMMRSSHRFAIVVTLSLAAAVGCNRGAASQPEASPAQSSSKPERRGPDSAGHHSRGAVGLPIALVDQAQSELQRMVRPCVEEARQRGTTLGREIRIVSTLQVESGEVRFKESRLARRTADLVFDRCVVTALGHASYPAANAPERALAMFSGTVPTVPR